MSEQTSAVQSPVKNHGWRVTFAGMGINLALGVLYSWSVVSKEIPKDWCWSEAKSAAGWVYDATKTFTFAYQCSAGLLIAAAVVTFIVKQPHHKAVGVQA